MGSFPLLLGSATLLSTLVAGFLFSFAVVVMQRIKTLGSSDFLRAFQVIDRVIQNGQPLFGLVCLGSIIATIACAILGDFKLDGLDRFLLMAASVIY